MEFVKYHGLGNDFVIVDARLGSAFAGRTLNEETIRRICDRRLGVGADGVLWLYTPENTETSPLGMRVYNADASIAEMCGNGLRCVARYAWDQGGISPGMLAVETGAGVLTAQPDPSGEVRVEMGPISTEGPASITLGDRQIEGLNLSLGNPHFAMSAASWGLSAQPVEAALLQLTALARQWGPDLSTHPDFPAGTNAGFLGAPRGDDLPLVVWERGSGLTGACGTGACAAANAQLIAEGRDDGAYTVHQPGGRLRIEIKTIDGARRAWMTGAAAYAFEGEWPT